MNEQITWSFQGTFESGFALDSNGLVIAIIGAGIGRRTTISCSTSSCGVLIDHIEIIAKKMTHEALAYLGNFKVIGNSFERDHLWMIGKLFKDPETPWQSLLGLSALFSHFHLYLKKTSRVKPDFLPNILHIIFKSNLFDFFDVLVQLKVIQNDGDEQTQHDLLIRV